MFERIEHPLARRHPSERRKRPASGAAKRGRVGPLQCGRFTLLRMTSDQAILSYATRPVGPARRPNWLAVFSFAWTFAVTPGVMLLFLRPAEGVAPLLPPWGGVALNALGLVGAPLVGWASAHVATERGAGFDSLLRWTPLAVWAAPVANVMLGAGLIVLFRELRLIPV